MIQLKCNKDYCLLRYWMFIVVIGCYQRYKMNVYQTCIILVLIQYIVLKSNRYESNGEFNIFIEINNVTI